MKKPGYRVLAFLWSCSYHSSSVWKRTAFWGQISGMATSKSRSASSPARNVTFVGPLAPLMDRSSGAVPLGIQLLLF